VIAVTAPTAASQFRLDLVRLAHKDHTHTEVARCSERAVDLSERRMVAAHCVENDLARQEGFILRLTSH
jgi:hypothetical protein